jgi:predicted  nucleic acid-binding Zn-ribbon protein
MAWRATQPLLLVLVVISSSVCESSGQVSADNTWLPMVKKMQELMVRFTEMKIDTNSMREKIAHLSNQVSHITRAIKNLKKGHRKLNMSMMKLKSTHADIVKAKESEYS